MNRPRTWRRRRAIAATVGFALVPGLLTSTVTYADDVKPLGRPALPAPRADKVTPFTEAANRQAAATAKKAEEATREDAARARTQQNAGTVTWPEAGTATLTLPAKGKAKAAPGTLPVTLAPPETDKSGRSAKSATPASSVTVDVLDQKKADALGVKGVVLTVTGPRGGGQAAMSIDYGTFATAYGGDWAGRLQVLRLPDCALRDPASAKCRTRTPVEFTNDREQETLNARLTFQAAAAPREVASMAAAAPAGGQMMVLAVAAGTKSGSGDYQATPLASSSTWEAGGSSGNFTWSYPLRVPPPAAGPKPELSISYDSSSVDGRTASTNNQGTVIGEGFDITSSYIERKYGSCDDDGHEGKHDLCWKYENASLVLNGKATELVKDDTTGRWRLKNDDASTVIHSTGADNGDNDGEYWTVITGDGTKYVFGLNKLAGAGTGDRTRSVWTVPVFGDDSGEPGYTDGTTFAGRGKTQAWRWNLDYVEDTHDNAMSYWYTAEANHYDKLGDDNTGTAYVRGGYLDEIRYGQRAGALFSGAPPASGKVVFHYAERCLAAGTGCQSLNQDTRDNWPDVPLDAICNEGAKCTGNTGPTFFTRKRMTAIHTYAWNAAAATPGFSAVDSWALTQAYLEPGDTGDATDQSLWLSRIQHTGKHGSPLTLDPVSFTHQWLANRVDGATDDILPLHKPRLYTITSETGAQTIVNYHAADCTAAQTKPRPDQNTKSCYPVYWSPNGAPEPQLDWFHKYPVRSVMTTAPRSGSEAVEHAYLYSGGGAWHYNEDPLVKEKERTWSVWRGFQKVTHLTGSGAGGRTQSKTVSVYLRGMNGDRVLGADGKLDPVNRKSVTVTGIKAPAVTDSEQYAGFIRESVTYNGASGPETSGQIFDPWSKRTATQHKSYADTEAYFVRTRGTQTRTNITTNIPPRDRVHSTVTAYDDYGMAETVDDKGDIAVAGDEKCTRNWYARNDQAGINNLVSRTRVTTRPCTTTDETLDLPATAEREGDVISDTATAYDSTTWTAAQTPTVGEPQWTGRAKGYGTDNQPVWQKVATTTYDTLGRPLTVRDTRGTLTASTQYTPTAAGPVTATSVTNAKTHKTTTRLDFATGVPLKVTDPNGRITESQYDSLGRITKVWLPDELRALGHLPNYVYTYSVTSSHLPWVSTGTLNAEANGYNTTYEIYDPLLRPRQTQTPSPRGGRLIALTVYDDRGLAVSAQADIWDPANAPSSQLQETDGGEPPMQTDTTYDGAGRATKTETKVRNVPRWTTETRYTGDTVTSTAPPGGQATAVVTDALGRTTERREYGGPQPTGDDYTTTRYTYAPTGRQSTVEGPDRTKWTYTHDLFGRQTNVTDPDKGTSTTKYDDLDQAETTTDSRGRILTAEYDILGRKTGLWDGGTKTDAKKLAAWTFDVLAKGQQDTAVRYENGVGQTDSKSYTQKVAAYDRLYRPTTTQLTLPADDPLVTGGVPQTLSATVAYNADGTVRQQAAPAVAGLPAETLSYKYGSQSQLLSFTGSTGYLQDALYSPLGDLRQMSLGTDPTASKKAYLTYDYEDGTRRLARSYVTDDVHGYMPQELKFTQDDAGNVTSIFDGGYQAGTGKPDYQCFAYDGHRRVKEAWTPSTADCAATGRTTSNIGGAAPYWTSYTYNGAGQRATETEHTASGDKTTTYTHGTPIGQPHPLAKTEGAKTGTYTYDKAGNTTGRPGTQGQQTLTWDAEGKLVSTTEPASGTKPALSTGYLYDASGELLIRRAVGDGDTVLYLGSTEIRLTTKGTTKTLNGTRYYSAAGKTIAVRTATAGVTGTKLSFLAGDHHGTSSLALDATTMAVTKRYTTPFGAPRGTAATTWPDDKAFLGKPSDTSTGLTHIGAREFDPSIGLFLSVDPLMELDKHQTLNGYTYGAQNPATFSDPSGMGLACGASGDGCPRNRNGGSSGQPDRIRGADHVDPNASPGTGGTNGTSGSGPACSVKEGNCLQDSMSGPSDPGPLGAFLLGLARNIPYTAELFGWTVDSDCRAGGGAGAPGCDYGTQYDLWAARNGYDVTGDWYLVPGLMGAVIAHRSPMPGPRRIPMGFPNAASFSSFGGKLKSGLKDAGYGGTTAVFHGSSVTGKSHKEGIPFGRHSDYDIALAGEGVLARAKQVGIPLRSRGSRTGPLTKSDLRKMGLDGLAKTLSNEADRRVNFMVYGSIEGATGRAPSIVVR
ncbi:RHS repeat-associated core domain-containing protein [Streptomyces sp. NPDC047928]|uniref:RHS repeat domain-containing protein n=1 Tax=unclassified Streptomyces TaxID=2593676 RepID=UPI00371A7E25